MVQHLAPTSKHLDLSLKMLHVSTQELQLGISDSRSLGLLLHFPGRADLGPPLRYDVEAVRYRPIITRNTLAKEFRRARGARRRSERITPMRGPIDRILAWGYFR